MKAKESLKNIELKDFDFRFVNISALIIKVTNKCNLNCKYCYEDISKKGDILPIETFKSIAIKAIMSSINQKITFIFHGGEPTLIPIQWYSEAVSFSNNLSKKLNKIIQFRLQTNLISVTDTKLLELNSLGIRISASIDAFNDINTAERGLYPKATFNFLRAKSLSINVSILSTINKSNFKAFIPFIKALKDDFGVRSFKANVAYPVGFGKFSEQLTSEEIFEAKQDILKSMIAEKGLGVNEINILKQIQKYFTPSNNCTNELCDKQTCGAGKNVLGISHNGDLLPCGRFSWNDATYYLGNLYEEIQELQFENSVSNFQTQNPQNWTDCKSCKASSICNFGCQAFISRSLNKVNIECGATKMLYTFFEKNLDDLKIIYENNKNRLETGYNDNYGDYSDTYYDSN